MKESTLHLVLRLRGGGGVIIADLIDAKTKKKIGKIENFSTG